jgi:hypothetical protein
MMQTTSQATPHTPPRRVVVGPPIGGGRVAFVRAAHERPEGHADQSSDSVSGEALTVHGHAAQGEA